LSIYKPNKEQQLLEYINKNYSEAELHKICCRHEPKVEEGSVIINVCAGCDRRFGSLYKGVSTISLWEVIDKAGSFPYPDYHGIKMSVHDACPIREKPQVHSAIRSLLHKMNIEIAETEFHGTHSVCCGDDFYPSLPVEQVHKKMKSRAASMPCDDVAVYCVSCIKSMFIGGKKPRHMVDLLFQETTTPEVYDTVEWHKQLQAYIDTH
jgi:Fe-S oxidoreductase